MSGLSTDPRERLAVLALRAGGWGKLAEQLGIHPVELSAMKNGRKSIPERVLAAIGLQRVITYVEIHNGNEG